MGLKNLGNTCYANTTFQCLIHAHALTVYMLRRTFEPHLTPRSRVVDAARPDTLVGGRRSELNRHPLTGTPSVRFLEAYFALLHEVWRRHTAEMSLPGRPPPPRPAFVPRELFAVASRASVYRAEQGESGTAFLLGQQHDIAEFLQFVLDLIHDTSQCVVRWTTSGTVADRRDQLTVESYKQFERHFGKQYSFVTDMMTGQYFVQTQTCDNRTPTEHCETFDPFTLLTLDLPVGRRACTLHDCFDLMVQPEIIDGWKGELSDTPRMVERKVYFWRLPNLLMVHLKRFANRFVKNNCIVEVARELDLSDYCMGEDASLARFELYAVANHEGNLQFGHYYADCKKPDGRWYRFNDAVVTEMDPSGLQGHTAYVLFYRRTGGVVVNPEGT